jgi:hypothetical protein
MDAGPDPAVPPAAIDPTLLVALGGRLEGQIADFDDDGTLDLRYRLELELTAGEMPVQLRLVGLVLPARSWRNLADLSITFGPSDVEIADGDPVRWAGLGDLSAGTIRQPLAATRVAVEQVLVNPPQAVVSVTADLYPSGAAPSADPAPFHVTATVAIGPVVVLGHWQDHAAALAAAEQFLDVTDYDHDVHEDLLRLTPRA